MTVPSYTEQDVEPLVEILHKKLDEMKDEWHYGCGPTDGDGPTPCSRYWAERAALREDVLPALLAALSSAGRLVPPGSEVREEWRVTGDPGHGFPVYDFTWSSARQDDPERAARSFVEKIQEHDTWPDGPHLAQRNVITTPWSPSVPDTKEGS